MSAKRGNLSVMERMFASVCGKHLRLPGGRRAHPRARTRGYPQRAAEQREGEGRRWLALCALSLVALVAFAGSGERLPASCAALAALATGVLAALRFKGARIARIGARSEATVQARLDPLRAEGWCVDHNLNFERPIGGDIDHIVIAPRPSPTFVIDTKTRRFDRRDITRLKRIASTFTAAQPMIVTIARVRTHMLDGVIVCDERSVVTVMRRCVAVYAERAGSRRLPDTSSRPLHPAGLAGYPASDR